LGTVTVQTSEEEAKKTSHWKKACLRPKSSKKQEKVETITAIQQNASRTGNRKKEHKGPNKESPKGGNEPEDTERGERGEKGKQSE